MDLETVVALLRNGFCVVKSLASPEHWSMQPYYGEITALECAIAPLQAAAVVYNLSSALPFLASGAASWLGAHAAPSEAQWEQAIQLAAKREDSASALAVQVACANLAAESATERTTAWMMVSKVAIGAAFVLLTLSSLHQPYDALINWALLLLQFALLHCLAVMADGVRASRQRAGDAARLADSLESKGSDPLDAPAAVPLLLAATHAALGRGAAELPASPWRGAVAAADPFGVAAAGAHLKALTAVEAELRAALAVLPSKRRPVAAELRRAARAQYAQAAVDAAVLALNAVAFLGYGVFPVTFFCADPSLKQWVPAWPGADAAQYWGNLAGDAAWTVEPALLMAAPLLLPASGAARAAAKEKDS